MTVSLDKTIRVATFVRTVRNKRYTFVPPKNVYQLSPPLVETRIDWDSIDMDDPANDDRPEAEFPMTSTAIEYVLISYSPQADETCFFHVDATGRDIDSPVPSLNDRRGRYSDVEMLIGLGYSAVSFY